MGTIRQRENGTFELRVVHHLLHRPYYSTHDSRPDAESYDQRLKAALNRGEVPPELLAPTPTRRDVKLSVMLRDYLNRGRISASDRPMVCWLQEQLDVGVRGITVKWVDEWVKRMKGVEHLAPGTIRKRVESLARAVDWWIRDAGEDRVNPLRTLPRGYSGYAEGEAPQGKDDRVDVQRDRRLHPGEVEKIEATIMGWKRPDRQRPLDMPDRDDIMLLFRTILNTGLRLREAYTLRWWQIKLDLKTIHIETSKTGRARDVPMLPAVQGGFLQACSASARDPRATVFALWDGTPETLDMTTRRLSARFSSIFKYAGCDDLKEHDLRHEATCRWMEMKDEKGRWLFRPEEVRRITGHKNVQQFERYLSLRGSDLADRIWSDDRS